MATISAQIPDELYKSLHSVAKKLELPSSYIIRKALNAYLEEVKDNNSSNIPWKQVQRKCGLLKD